MLLFQKCYVLQLLLKYTMDALDLAILGCKPSSDLNIDIEVLEFFIIFELSLNFVDF